MLGVITRTVRQIEREPTHKATLFLIIFAQLVCQKVLLTRFVIYYFKKKKSTPRYTLPQKNRLRRPQIETRYSLQHELRNSSNRICHLYYF